MHIFFSRYLCSHMRTSASLVFRGKPFSYLRVATCPTLRWSARIRAPLSIGTGLSFGIRRQQLLSLPGLQQGRRQVLFLQPPLWGLLLKVRARSGVAGDGKRVGSHRPALLLSLCLANPVFFQFLAATIIFLDAVLTP